MSWREESAQKEHESEAPSRQNLEVLEEERVIHLEQMEELRIENENNLQQMQKACDQRLVNFRELEQYKATEVDNPEHEKKLE